MRKRFSLEERIQIANEYYHSSASNKDICQKYGISSHSLLCQWVKKYVIEPRYSQKVLPLSRGTVSVTESFSSEPMHNDTLTIQQLRSRIAELEKSLEWEKMRSHALETLIDVAEEQGIKVRKKSGAKR